MFTRLKKIENQLKQIIRTQEIHGRILTDIAESLDHRRAAGSDQRAALEQYVGQVSGLLEQKGAAPEFFGAFKNLFQRIK